MAMKSYETGRKVVYDAKTRTMRTAWTAPLPSRPRSRGGSRSARPGRALAMRRGRAACGPPCIRSVRCV